jgi:hypothetical protein
MTPLVMGLWFGILLPRAMIQTFRLRSPTIKAYRTHHWMLGAGWFLVGLTTNTPLLVGFGGGLFLDEIPWMVWGIKVRPDHCYERTAWLVVLLGYLITVVSR